jgi:RNA polymerase sigma-70 factor (ECF subfamily)
MFSTPGSPAHFAKEIVNASSEMPDAAAEPPRQRCTARSTASSAPMRPVNVDRSASCDEVARDRSDHRLRAAETNELKASVHQLYREYSPRLVRRLTRETGCRELALELANEAFVRLLQMTPARFFGIGHPRAYLTRISMNLLRDRGRSSAIAERSSADLEILAEGSVDQIAILETRDTLRRLELAMDKMKPKTRAIFLAHRLDGLTYAEIAERAGMSVKGVEKQMSKALAKIDRFLERG